MTNKMFNIIAIGIGIVLLVILFNVVYIYNRNEASKVYFNINDIKNINWINDDVSFKIEDDKLTFIKDDVEIVKNKSMIFNNRTGRIDVGNKVIYLRSVSKDTIIIWYEKQEFNLDKEIIAK